MTLTGGLFLLCFTVTCALAVFRHPIFGVLGYVALVMLDPASRWWGQALPELRWSLLSVLMILIGFVLHQRVRAAIRIREHAVFIGMLVLTAYSWAQTPWVASAESHALFLEYYWKYVLAMYLIYMCVDSERHLQWLVWAFVLGAGYLAGIANQYHVGGRFDDFGGAGIGEANAGGLTIALGVFLGSALFLGASTRQRIVLFLMMPLMLNAIVMTVSRSTFLALLTGGLAFVIFTPSRYRRRVTLLAILALALFAILADPSYWNRMATLKYRGADVEGVDTGTDRLATIRAQIEMFREYPMGCGHKCTDVMSVEYIDMRFRNESTGVRSSHNTTMSMLVDHGYLGGAVYGLFVLWSLNAIRRIARDLDDLPPSVALLLPGLAACVVAQFVADQFVPYVRYEPRYWIIVLLMIVLKLAEQRRSELGSRAITESSKSAAGAVARP